VLKLEINVSNSVSSSSFLPIVSWGDCSVL